MRSVHFLILSLTTGLSAFAVHNANEALENHPGVFQDRIDREWAEKELMRLEAEMLPEWADIEIATERAAAYREKERRERVEGQEQASEHEEYLRKKGEREGIERAQAKQWARDFIDDVLIQLNDPNNEAAKHFLQQIRNGSVCRRTLAGSNTNEEFYNMVDGAEYAYNYFTNEEFRNNPEEYSYTFQEGPFKDWSIRTGNNNYDVFCVYHAASCFSVELVAPYATGASAASSCIGAYKRGDPGIGFYLFTGAIGGLAGLLYLSI